MGLNYVLLASILMYVVMVRVNDRFNLSIFTSAAVTVLGSFALSLSVKYLFLTGHGLSLSGLLGGKDVLLACLQLLVATFVFYALNDNEENIAVWFGWAVGGGYLLFFGLPFLIGLLLQ